MVALNPKELYELLAQKGIFSLYHADTITTSCSFINAGGLLSRGSLEEKQLPMSAQKSDEVDKRVGVWKDLFLDVFDLHVKYQGPNDYGPVCFVINSEILLDENLPNICITKDNPHYWSTTSDYDENYFSSVNEYKEVFDQFYDDRTIQRKMLTIRKTNYIIPFDKYLEEIIVDNPKIISNGIDLFYNGFGRIRSCLYANGFNTKLLNERNCPYPGCYCTYRYKHFFEKEKLERFFL